MFPVFQQDTESFMLPNVEIIDSQKSNAREGGKLSYTFA